MTHSQLIWEMIQVAHAERNELSGDAYDAQTRMISQLVEQHEVARVAEGENGRFSN